MNPCARALLYIFSSNFNRKIAIAIVRMIGWVFTDLLIYVRGLNYAWVVGRGRGLVFKLFSYFYYYLSDISLYILHYVYTRHTQYKLKCASQMLHSHI